MNKKKFISIIKNRQATIKKITLDEVVYLQALEQTLDEWGSGNDAEDYKDLCKIDQKK